MEYRHVSNPYVLSRLHQHDNNRSPVEHHTPTGGTGINPSFVAPMDMTRVGLHSDPYRNLGGTSNEYSSSNISMELQHLPQDFSAPLPNSYTHSSITRNTSLTPVTPIDGGIQNSMSANETHPFKRKLPGMSESGERGSMSNFYGAGSSSCYSVPSYRGANLSIGGEDTLRNVRSRSRHELEPCVTNTNAPSYTSHYYQSSGHSANCVATAQPVNVNADVTSREWNSVPHHAVSSHGWTSTPDINGPRHETRQFYGGGSSVDVDTCHNDSFFSRSHVPFPQLPHVSHDQSTRYGNSYHSRRVAPSYGSGPGFPYNTHGGSSSTSELQFPTGSFFSTYSRRSSAGRGSSGYRNERPSNAVESFQPFSDTVHPGDRLGHEQTLMVDQLSFYNSPVNMLDEYQDMRLDVDSMSYEELLALEETMGDVCTGLSEDMMSNCLREQVHCCVDGNNTEDTCPICLDEYKNGEKVGRMEKCGHDYHIDCIKKWLVMKKVCPICKSDCSSQETPQP